MSKNDSLEDEDGPEICQLCANPIFVGDSAYSLTGPCKVTSVGHGMSLLDTEDIENIGIHCVHAACWDGLRNLTKDENSARSGIVGEATRLNQTAKQIAERRPSAEQIEPKLPPPAPTLIRSPRDAEAAACRWMQFWGFPDAELTQEGADGGIDVQCKYAVAQVKAEVLKTSRPVLQGLFGVAKFQNKIALFFSLAGYTEEAREWAEKADIALFTFDLAGAAEPVNPAARRITERTVPQFSAADLHSAIRNACKLLEIAYRRHEEALSPKRNGHTVPWEVTYKLSGKQVSIYGPLNDLGIPNDNLLHIGTINSADDVKRMVDRVKEILDIKVNTASRA